MCCLAYEEKFYSDALERYPDIGSVFEMENKEFTVVKHNVLKKIVYLQSRDGDFCQLSLEECQNLKLLRRPNNYETEQDDMLSDSEIDPI